ncbi:MAG TPA: hypothetical protein VKM72_06940, partial [Thermoanaerobaculia bacterium]|nr:hypothetical protein [Thermoanaerobaculia bacterium]
MTGRRPGAGATLAAVLAAALFPTLATWLYFVALPGSRWMLPVYGATKILQFAFPLIWFKLQGKQVKLLRPASPGPSPPGPLSHTHFHEKACVSQVRGAAQRPRSRWVGRGGDWHERGR